MKNIETINIHIVHDIDLMDHRLLGTVNVAFLDGSAIQFTNSTTYFHNEEEASAALDALLGVFAHKIKQVEEKAAEIPTAPDGPLS